MNGDSLTVVTGGSAAFDVTVNPGNCPAGYGNLMNGKTENCAANVCQKEECCHLRRCDDQNGDGTKAGDVSDTF